MKNIKFNVRAFTLIELLAVIIILSLLALLVSTSVTKMLKDSKEDMSSIQVELIKSAAEMWGSANIDKIPKANECGYITLKDLKDFGVIDSKVIDSNTNNEIDDDLKIKITSNMTKKGVLSTEYEVNPEDTTNCPYINLNE